MTLTLDKRQLKPSVENLSQISTEAVENIIIFARQHAKKLIPTSQILLCSVALVLPNNGYTNGIATAAKAIKYEVGVVQKGASDLATLVAGGTIVHNETKDSETPKPTGVTKKLIDSMAFKNFCNILDPETLKKISKIDQHKKDVDTVKKFCDGENQNYNGFVKFKKAIRRVYDEVKTAKKTNEFTALRNLITYINRNFK